MIRDLQADLQALLDAGAFLFDIVAFAVVDVEELEISDSRMVASLVCRISSKSQEVAAINALYSTKSFVVTFEVRLSGSAIYGVMENVFKPTCWHR